MAKKIMIHQYYVYIELNKIGRPMCNDLTESLRIYC